MIRIMLCVACLAAMALPGLNAREKPAAECLATFSIVGRDPATGELGVAVASKFFAVGTVVPWAKAGVGAVATQAYANTSFGWRGLRLFEQGLTPEETAKVMLRLDDNAQQRQLGLVAADGSSYSFTGDKCLDWAGGRTGENYAVQGNILAGEQVVLAMEESFLSTQGSLADRLYAALLAGEKAGGDARGKQSAALLVVSENGGYGGFTDKAIDIRVDDHEQPFKELGRLLDVAQVHYFWNTAWNLFLEKQYAQALRWQQKAIAKDGTNGGLWYDLAVIRLAAGDREGALTAIQKACSLEPRYKDMAGKDPDLAALHADPAFIRLNQQ